MAAVPLTAYLARRNPARDEVSESRARQLEIREATETAYRQGLQDGMEQARAACDAAIAQMEEDAKDRLDRARKVWAEAEGAVLMQQTSDAIAAMQAEIEETAARILRPLVEKTLAEEALAKLASEIGKLLSDDDAIHLKMCGPVDLVARVSDRLAEKVSLTVIAGDRPEVTVFANKTVIETRMKEWLECIGVDSHAPETEG